MTRITFCAALFAGTTVASLATALVMTATAGPASQPMQVVELPRVVVTGQRMPVVELPRVVVTGQRLQVVELPRVVVTGQRVADPAATAMAQAGRIAASGI